MDFPIRLYELEEFEHLLKSNGFHNIVIHEVMNGYGEGSTFHVFECAIIKSFKRFEKAIKNTLIKFSDKNVEVLFQKVLQNEGISFDVMLILFWNASFNNELLDYLNQMLYFPALYSGRVTIKKDEVLACLKELKQTEVSVQMWSDSTIETIARKYLTLLKKFNLMEGTTKKL